VSLSTAYASRLSPRRRRLTLAAVVSGMFLASLDGTVVATAMPTVIGDLHGLDHYAWVFTAYLLAEIATIPLWGRFADMYGRKKVFLTGMVIFMVGSMLCGAAGSMMQLILFRALQGVGAGCGLPVAQTIVADLYTIKPRPKISMLFSVVFGFGSIVGPLVGGFLTEHLSWRWVFYVNLPVGVFTLLMVAFVMIEPLQYRHKHRIDWLGMITLLAWTGLLVFALESGGRDYGWGSFMIVGALVASVALLVAFLFIERRASEPLIPFDLFKIPTLLASNAIGVGIGMVMFGTLSFLPLFVQVVNQSSATQAGRILTPMMLAMVVASPIAARLILRVGYRALSVAGFGFTLIGTFLLTRLDTSTSEFETGVCMVFIGFGVGVCFLTTILASQNSVDLPRMGVATGLVNFTRQLGGALGVAVAGAVMLTSLTSRLADLFPGQHIPAGALLSAQTAKAFPAETQDAVRGAFAHALHLVFVTMFVIAIVGAFTTLLMPRGKPVFDQDAETGEHPMDEATLPDGETFTIVSPIDAADGADASDRSDEEVAAQPAVGATGLPR
jgi:EmrB/QacA subfamily drug resistance transporter